MFRWSGTNLPHVCAILAEGDGLLTNISRFSRFVNGGSIDACVLNDIFVGNPLPLRSQLDSLRYVVGRCKKKRTGVLVDRIVMQVDVHHQWSLSSSVCE
jgi:hypothetical protein